MQIKNRLHTLKFGLKPAILKASRSSVEITKDTSTKEAEENAECLVIFPSFSSKYE